MSAFDYLLSPGEFAAKFELSVATLADWRSQKDLGTGGADPFDWWLRRPLVTSNVRW